MGKCICNIYGNQNGLRLIQTSPYPLLMQCASPTIVPLPLHTLDSNTNSLHPRIHSYFFMSSWPSFKYDTDIRDLRVILYVPPFPHKCHVRQHTVPSAALTSFPRSPTTPLFPLATPTNHPSSVTPHGRFLHITFIISVLR